MLYYWVKMFNKIYLFCPTYLKDLKWRCMDKHVSSGRIVVYGIVRNQTLKNLWARCDKALLQNPNSQFLFYFDDCAGQEEFKLDSEKGMINQLVSKGNHSHISTAWVVQKFTQSSTIMRLNAEGMISFYVQSEDELKYIWKEFGVGKYSYFKKILQDSTREKYHNFYVNRQGPGMADYYHNFKFIPIK